MTGVEAVAAILTALGIGSVITAFVTGVFGRRKNRADTAEVLTGAARELVAPLLDRVREQETENKRLRHRIEDMESDLRWLRAERGDQIRRDTLMQTHLRALNDWTAEWLPRARELGLVVAERPKPPDLIPLMDPSLLTHPHPRDRGEKT